MYSDRDLSIDYLRVLGLFLIIFAHVSPPDFIFEIRNFDVPLMVIVSALSFSISYNNGKYFDYVKKRFMRLVFPVWIFLSFYFSFFKLSGSDFSIYEVVTSYSLVSGIGYVWIIRVFLFIALVSPFLFRFSRFLKTPFSFLAVVISMLILEQVLRIISLSYEGAFLKIFTYIFIYSFGFSIPFMCGLYFSKFNKKDVVLFFVVSSSMFFMILFAYFSFSISLSLQSDKYPPGILYLTFSMSISSGLFYLLKSIKLKSFDVLIFVSSNSIWIYLWHIMFLNLVQSKDFLSLYFLVLMFSLFVTYVQVNIVKWVCRSFVKNSKNKRIITSLFTG